MTKAEIISEVRRLNHAERRELLREILSLEGVAEELDEIDRLADQRFHMLDLMEEEDGKTSSG